jgi:cyclophilin family peptidyl-prolyl cis-trans isomerase/HEAT repeat protein
MKRKLTTAGALALVTIGCASAPQSPPSGEAATAPVDRRREERALLLLLEDRRVFEAGVLQGLLSGPPPTREMLATALGRIGDPHAVSMLAILVADAEAPVRRAAAFALGELGDKAATNPLLRAASDADAETGQLAVEALGKIAAPLADVSSALSTLAEAERARRLLPFLFRFKEASAVPVAEAGLTSSDAALHAAAAYALAREPRAEGITSVRGLLADGDPWIRGLAARALGIVGDGSDFVRLRALLDDPAPGPTVQALRAARKLIQGAKGAAPADWLPRLRDLVRSPNLALAVTATEASASWLPDETLDDLLVHSAAGGEPRLREVALLALAEAKRPAAMPAVMSAARSGDPVLRARAAEAAGTLGNDEALELLAADADPGVRAAVLSARLTGSSAESAAREALSDDDAVVRATGLDWLAEHPLLGLTGLEGAIAKGDADSMPDALLSATRALAARGKAEALERGQAVVALERLAAHRDYLVRREAGARLVELGRPAPAVGAASRRELPVYRDILRETSEPRLVELDTRRGKIRLRLACPEAPLTCLNFIHLARQGYFDGLRFHRVVPDFVAQGGDPRGDGSGGPGYSIRDEINRLRYRRGAVGMALSGPDTGGSQFFIALTPQPHLDGGYTVFGEVVAGDDVLDQIVQGDRIVAARVLP